MFLITRPPPLETSASQAYYLIITSAELVPRLLEVRGKTAHALFAARKISGSLLSIQGQYGLHVFDVQRAEQDDGVFACKSLL